jgi:predicted TIM-barrel fold metal-dependent hydrolase
VFGPRDGFPYAAERTFTPPDVPVEALRARHDFLGLERAVIVQSVCHGTDHSALLHALAAGRGRYRGVALLTPRTGEAEISRLHAAGVRGVRFSFLPHLGDGPAEGDVHAVLAAVESFGWHATVHVAGDGIIQHARLIGGITGPAVIDHMARIDLADPAPAMRTLRTLLDRGNVWLKLSGIDRLSAQGPPYDDAVALAATLARYAPERMLWGTDFPHPNISGSAPDDGLLVELTERIVPDESRRHAMLVTNPATVFGFT